MGFNSAFKELSTIRSENPKSRPSIEPIPQEPDDLNKAIIIYLFIKRVFTDWVLYWTNIVFSVR